MRQPPSPAVAALDRSWYPEHRDNWDDALFREAVLAILRPEHRLLDLGAGAGIVAQMDFKASAARVCGVDPDPRVLENPFLHEGRVGTGEAVPYPDESFDVVIADNVLEHLERPELVFAEIRRVLKPGGAFLAKTPNRRHYMPLIARLTPLWFHRLVNRLRGRAGEDTFPTRYRANTSGELAALAQRAGLRVEKVRLVEGRPEYLRVCAVAYAFGRLYERLVNRVPGLERFRILLICRMTKP